MTYAITLPNGRRVSLPHYVMGWRVAKESAPETLFKGFYDFPTMGGQILAEFRRGLHDRINRRGAVTIREPRACPAVLAKASAPRVILERSDLAAFNRHAKPRLAHRERD